jgi:hypothetical protein
MAATAAVAGGIAMIEADSKSWTFIVIEGEACVKLKHSTEPCLKLHPGEMLILPPEARRFTEKKNVNLKKLTRTAGLIHQAPLPGGPGCHFDCSGQPRELAAARRLCRSERHRGDRPKGRRRSNSETYSSSAAFSRLGASAGVCFGCAEREHGLALRSPRAADLW